MGCLSIKKQRPYDKSKIVSKDTMSVFKELDSAVTFGFYEVDSTGATITGSPVNLINAVLSYHHGFLKMPRWREFPSDLATTELKGMI